MRFENYTKVSSVGGKLDAFHWISIRNIHHQLLGLCYFGSDTGADLKNRMCYYLNLDSGIYKDKIQSINLYYDVYEYMFWWLIEVVKSKLVNILFISYLI